MKKIHFSIFTIVALMFVLNACNNSKSEVQPAFSEDALTFTKDVVVYDQIKQNSVTIRLSAADKSLLDEYDATNFVLTALKKGQKIAATQQDQGQEADSDLETDENPSPGIAFEVVQRNLSAEFTKVAVTFKHPQTDSRKKWGYYWHYSQAGVDHTASIDRSNAWRRVFFGLKYKQTSTSSWSTIVSEWRKLGNNDTYTAERATSYQFRFRVKTKKQSAYTVYFEP